MKLLKWLALGIDMLWLASLVGMMAIGAVTFSKLRAATMLPT